MLDLKLEAEIFSRLLDAVLLEVFAVGESTVEDWLKQSGLSDEKGAVRAEHVRQGRTLELWISKERASGSSRRLP